MNWVLTKIEKRSYLGSLYESLVSPQPWFYSWYRGRVEALDAKYNLAYITSTAYDHTNSSMSAMYLK